MKKFLIIIILIAAALRFWQLGAVPPSPDWDEAALGYNAYSILKTGRDEFGVFLPRVLRSFDDFKPPLYAYLAIPSVAVFGLEVASVRLPSAVMGVLAVLGTYFLIFEILSREKRRAENEVIALLTAFLLAISPWHIQFSRIAFEANIALTITIWAVYALLRGLSQTKWMAASAFLFGLGFYAYHSARVFLPLIALVLLFVYKKEILAAPKRLAIGVAVGLLTILPLLPVLFSSQSVTRLSGTSVLADKTGILMRSVAKLQDDQAAGNPFGILFDNRRVVYAQKLLDGYLSHFSMRWLFLTGDNDRHHAPGMGLLYLAELPFLLWGIFLVWKRKDRVSRIFLSWALLAPIAASPTSETPHAIRSLVFLPALQFFVATAILAFWEKKGKWAILVKAVFVAVFAVNIVFYLHMYFVHMNIEYSKFWQYGYKQAVEYAKENRSKYEKIVVSTRLEQPHMFFLFYTKYDPVKYLSEGGTASGGFAEWRNRFDIYEFRPIYDWQKEIRDGKTLYIGTPGEILNGPINSIYYLNGEEAIRMGK
jgi:4-amino-4-deoxy-L-arabinose transferase-like glycosyltransferase